MNSFSDIWTGIGLLVRIAGQVMVGVYDKPSLDDEHRSIGIISHFPADTAHEQA
jgi:hypothetical protein